MDEIRDTLDLMLNIFRRMENSFNNELKNYPEGRLRCYKRNGRNNFFRAEEVDGRLIRYGITRNEHQIHQLARKRFLEELVNNTSDNIHVVDNAIKKLKPIDGDSILAEMPKAYRELPESFFLTRPADIRKLQQTEAGPSQQTKSGFSQRTNSGREYARAESIQHQNGFHKASNGYHKIANGIYVPDSLREAAIQGTLSSSQREQIREIQREWANQKYPQNAKNLEQKKIITSQGLKVRSMAEGAIAETIYEHDIPFRHDQIVTIGNRTVSPDFSFLSIIRGEIYWEHCGMTNSQKYIEYQKFKRELYESIGFVPWKNFIVTYNEENGFFDTREMEAIITNKLTRWLCLD